MGDGVYALDANVFIGAWRGYYHPAIAPVFWETLFSLAGDGRVSSIGVRPERSCRPVSESSSSAIWLSPSQIRACGFPALGSSWKYPQARLGGLPGMSDLEPGQWKALLEHPVEPAPGECASSLPSSQHAIPQPHDLPPKGDHRSEVARQTVIRVVPSEHAAQPPVLRGHGRMHELLRPGAQFLELAGHPSALRLATPTSRLVHPHEVGRQSSPALCPDSGLLAWGPSKPVPSLHHLVSFGDFSGTMNRSDSRAQLSIALRFSLALHPHRRPTDGPSRASWVPKVAFRA